MNGAQLLIGGFFREQRCAKSKRCDGSGHCKQSLYA